MTSGRQEVDSWGKAWQTALKALCHNVCSRTGGLQGSITRLNTTSCLVHLGLINANYNSGASVIGFVYYHHCTGRNLPALPPLYLHTWSSQILAEVKDWEQGYCHLYMTCLDLAAWGIATNCYKQVCWCQWHLSGRWANLPSNIWSKKCACSKGRKGMIHRHTWG